MRGFSVCGVLVTVLFVAGCGGGGGGGGGGTSSSKPSAEGTKPAGVVVADAAKAAEAASSFHMSGQVPSSGRRIGIDLSIVHGKGATGTITVGGAKVDLVLVGNTAYLRAGPSFWKQYSQASGVSQLLVNKWLKFPAKSAELGSLTGQANAEALFKSLARNHGKLENQGKTTYKGQSVVAIHGVTKNGTLYVAASGTPYPVAVVKTEQPNAGTVTFDQWNEPVTLTAPKGALDFSQLGNG
jgi:hypothetical protein